MINVETILKISLFVALLCSFYIFFSHLVLKNSKYNSIFSTWQFPMILAIFLDLTISNNIIYVSNLSKK